MPFFDPQKKRNKRVTRKRKPRHTHTHKKKKMDGREVKQMKMQSKRERLDDLLDE